MFRLASAAACVLAGALVYLAAVHVGFVATADLRVLEGFMGLPGEQFARPLVSLFDPGSFAVLAGALVAAALLAGRIKPALVAATIMLGAGVTTQVLKPLLAVQRDYPEFHYMGPVAFPSGHTTAAMSFALALIVVAPARLRPLAVAVGGLLTVAVMFSLLELGSHYPSDVIGGLLVATGWACLASAAPRLSLRGPALAAAVLGVAAAVLVALRPEAVLAYASANTTFVLGALAIAAGALVLSGSVPAPTAAPRRPRSPRARG
ncbi:MAG TPA: phosphatase PAP2 family protein [Solirubrobacter sp.]|nr:phosphatase PAP2 family protein [Solirubrobacter sp.]